MDPTYLEKAQPSTHSGHSQDRLLSLDMYRGLVLALILLEAANYGWQHTIADAFPDSGLARFVGNQASHVIWTGCSLWDLIQPSFMFLVGVAMAFSCAKRSRLGQSYGAMLLHAAGRALILIFLGVFLRSNGESHTQWTFEDVITQIGLGYVFLFLLWDRGWKIQGLAAVVILVFYWMLFAMAPLPGPEFDWSIAAGDGWKEEVHKLSGYAAHWNKNANPAHAFDVWFLNGFPRPEPFVANEGGYVTLNFIPSLATMIFGLIAGEYIRRSGRNWDVVRVLAFAGVFGLITGVLLDASDICPLVKRIWTPAFTLYSTGWCLLILSGLFVVIDLAGARFLAKPFAILGMNSILVYVMIWLLAGWINQTLRTHLGQDYGAAWFGEPFRPLMENLATLAVVWGVAWLCYRKRIFLKI